MGARFPSTGGGIGAGDVVAVPRAAIQGVVTPLYNGQNSRPTVYVDRTHGNDANNGLLPATAFATLPKAVSVANTVYNGADIRLIGDPGTWNVAAPLHFVEPIWIIGLGTHNPAITRNFGTPNGRSVNDAVTVAASTTVTSATIALGASDNNRIVMIYGAGLNGGTYYGFIASHPNSTTMVLDVACSVARNSTTDPRGVKLTIVGDWNRVVTDAAITSGGRTLTSATAAFTSADAGTEVVIAGAGHGGQALRAVISGVQSGTSVTINGLAATTVTNKSCAIGVVFGDFITLHVSGAGLRNVTVEDDSTGQNRIGAAIKMLTDDGNSGTGAYGVESVQVTSGDPAGAWEHVLDIDGSWSQTGALGTRQIQMRHVKFFGARTGFEQYRLNSVCHLSCFGFGTTGKSPTNVPQGIVVLDPLATAGGGHASVDVHFTGMESELGSFYCEGQYCSLTGGSMGQSMGSATTPSIWLAPSSDHCRVTTNNLDSRASGRESDQGTNNIIDTNLSIPVRVLLTRSGIIAAPAAATYILDGTTTVVSAGSSTTSALAYVYLDPAAYGMSGKAPLLYVQATLLVNAVAPAVNFGFGLVPVSGNPAGGAGVVTQVNGNFVGSSVTVTTPAATSRNQAAGTPFAFPTAGYYALAITPSGSATVNSSVAVTAQLIAVFQ